MNFEKAKKLFSGLFPPILVLVYAIRIITHGNYEIYSKRQIQLTANHKLFIFQNNLITTELISHFIPIL